WCTANIGPPARIQAAQLPNACNQSGAGGSWASGPPPPVLTTSTSTPSRSPIASGVTVTTSWSASRSAATDAIPAEVSANGCHGSAYRPWPVTIRIIGAPRVGGIVPSLCRALPRVDRRRVAYGRCMAEVTLFHNPRCSTSRAALGEIEARGVDAEVVRYLTTPLDEVGLRELLDKLEDPPTDL